MATGMHMDKRNVDCLVLGHHDQDRRVSAKSVTMRAMTLCKNLSGYRELLLTLKAHNHKMYDLSSSKICEASKTNSADPDQTAPVGVHNFCLYALVI